MVRVCADLDGKISVKLKYKIIIIISFLSKSSPDLTKNNMCLSSGKSQSGLDIPLNRDFIEKGELLLLLC